MSDAPLVSVIIPVYNLASMISTAIESCQRQTVSDIEILVIDDGSTDGTVAAVEKFTGDPRVQLVKLGQNRGVSVARNLGFDRATGAWIATVDADDYISNDRLEVLVAAAQATGADMISDDEMLIHDGATEAYSTLSESSRYTIDPTRPVDLDQLVDCEIGGPSRFRLGITKPMIRRTFIEQHQLRYDPRLKVGEDYLLYLECVLAGAKWMQIPVPQYFYVQRPDSATSRPQVPTIESKLNSCDELLERDSLSDDQRETLRRYRRNLRSILAYQRVIEPAKARDFKRAAKAMAKNPEFFVQATRQFPDAVKRRWAYYVRRDKHAFDMLR